MDQYEEAVLQYLCGRPERFVNAQLNLPFSGIQGGSCPDFVTLDFGDKTVYVVEVTSAADTKNLLGRVRERESRWLNPLRAHFSHFGGVFANWDYHVTLFVREEEVSAVRKVVAEFPDVSVFSLKNAVFSWNWDWRRDTGLPTNPLREPSR